MSDKKPNIKRHLVVPIWALLLASTIIIGGTFSTIIGVLSFFTSNATVDTITTSLRTETIQSVYGRVTTMLSNCQHVLEANGRNPYLNAFIQNPNMTAAMSQDLLLEQPQVVAHLYQMTLQNSFLANTGFFLNNSDYIATYPGPMKVYWQDKNTYNTTTNLKELWSVDILGVYNNYTLNLGSEKALIRRDWFPNLKWPQLASANGSAFWVSKIFTPVQKTFLFPLFWPVWYQQPFGTITPNEPYYATHFIMLSTRSIESILASVNVSTNGVVSLWESTGSMIAASVPGVSQIENSRRRLVLISLLNLLLR